MYKNKKKKKLAAAKTPSPLN